jgi:hypothetical protein
MQIVISEINICTEYKKNQPAFPNKTSKLNTPKPILDFLLDDDFIRHICNPTPETEKLWQNYFILHPEKKAFAAEAGSIILGQQDFVQIPDDVFHSCLTAIQRKIN